LKKENKHPNLLNIFEFFVKSDDKLCSSVKRLIWILEYFEFDLTIEVKKTQKKKKIFNKI
jgi:hypothetical protein